MAAAKQERLSAFASCVKYVEITWRKNPTCPGASDVEAESRIWLRVFLSSSALICSGVMSL